MLPTRIEYQSADPYYTYTMYHLADVRWDVLNDIMSSYYLHNHRIFGLNALLPYTSLTSATLAHHTLPHPLNFAKPPKHQAENQGLVTEYFGQNPFLNLILILTLTYINNPDFCTLLYHYITIPSPPLSFCLSGFQSRCVRAHTETHIVCF
jgi:hypothetical protein